MAKIRCRSCGHSYRYEGDCCPGCGAFNRRPSREFIGADGEVHYVSDKVCYEKKVCYEEQAEKSWKASPDRKPERSGVKRPGTVRRPNTTASRAEQGVKGFAQKVRQSSTSSARRGGSSGNTSSKVWAVIGLAVAILGFAMNVVDDLNIELFSSQREPDFAVEVPARPDPGPDAIYDDYGGSFTTGDGALTAFVVEGDLNDDGVMTLKTYCGGDSSRFEQVVVDELTGRVYTPALMDEWQLHNYELVFELPDHDPANHHYGVYTLDRRYKDMYLMAEFTSEKVDRVNQWGSLFDFTLLDGETLHASVLMSYDEIKHEVVVYVLHDGDPERFQPHLSRDGAEVISLYGPPIDYQYKGEGDYQYRFDAASLEPDSDYTFCYLDDATGDILYMTTVYVPAAPGSEPVETSMVLADNMEVNVAVSYEYVGDILKVYATHNGDAAWLQPFAYDPTTDIYYEMTEGGDDGAGAYTYVFDMTGSDPSYRLIFGYKDVRGSGHYFLADCIAW